LGRQEADLSNVTLTTVFSKSDPRHLLRSLIPLSVRNAVNDHRVQFPKRTLRFLTEEEKDALAKGNSDEMIRVNKEKYDYSGVREKDRLMAERWYMATTPYHGENNPELRAAYTQYRILNVPKMAGYKGGLIIEKATGKSVSPPEWESEDEEEEVSEVGEDEVTVAMAAVRVQ